jgi:hypothetical protein
VEVKSKRVGEYDDRKGMLTAGALADGGGPSRRQEACAREGELRLLIVVDHLACMKATVDAVWAQAWARRATRTTACGWPGGARSARHGHGSRGTWHKGRGPEGRWAREGPLARGPTDQRRPRRAGPVEPHGDARRRRALWSARSRNSSDWHALTLFFSKKLNCSGQTLEY